MEEVTESDCGDPVGEQVSGPDEGWNQTGGGAVTAVAVFDKKELESETHQDQ